MFFYHISDQNFENFAFHFSAFADIAKNTCDKNMIFAQSNDRHVFQTAKTDLQGLHFVGSHCMQYSQFISHEKSKISGSTFYYSPPY